MAEAELIDLNSNAFHQSDSHVLINIAQMILSVLLLFKSWHCRARLMLTVMLKVGAHVGIAV